MRRLFLVITTVLCLAAIGFVCDETHYAETFNLAQQQVAHTEFVLVIDKSGSMRGERLQEARAAATDFVQALVQGQQVAVIAFDDRAEVVSEMTADAQALTQAIASITPGFWTAYLPALSAAKEQFSPQANKIIIFLSDGVDEEPPRVRTALEALLQQGICVYTVAYAAEEGADVLLGGMADFSRELTGCGGFFEAQENGFELEYAFLTLHRDISGEDKLAVTTTFETNGHASATVHARYLAVDLFAENTCYQPQTTLTVWEGDRIVFREQSTTQSYTIPLNPGTYRYETTVVETCQGNCYVYGTDQGTVAIKQQACVFTEQDYFSLFTPDVVRITETEFIPRTVGTSGTVIWINEDTKPRRVRSAQGDWESPEIAPETSWSRTFTEGLHGYTDEEGTFTASVRNTKQSEPSQFVFVFDNSGSMAGPPLDAAKDAATAFVDLLGPQDRASFIVFDQRVRLLQDATTTDRVRLRAAIQGIRAEGYSLYIPALELAGTQLNQPITRKPVVIFLSDGLPRDAQGIQGILQAIDEYLPGACLHVIAYLSDDPEARSLLESMALHAEKNARCGAFHTVADDGEELRAVLGEIYVGAQPQLLEFTDIRVVRDKKEYTLYARVRSAQTGRYLPTTQDPCLPPANVRVRVGLEEYALNFTGEHYVTTIVSPRAEKSVQLLARITAQDSARTATATVPLPLPQPLPYGWLIVAGIGAILVLIASMRARTVR